MAGTTRAEVTEKDVAGLKYFDKLAPLLERLHDDACQRDKAGNRQLHFDQYTMLVLLFLFNPIVGSLRAIEQASGLKKVQRRLGCSQTSATSLSEASRLFDAERLKGIIEELGGQLQPIGRDARLKDIEKTLTLVDGTLLAALPLMAEASLRNQQKGSGMVKWRLHTQFEVERYVPKQMDLTRNGGGETDERSVMERNVESERCYVMDRGYAKFTLFNEIHGADSNYVCRLRDNSVYEVIEERPLTEAAKAAGIVFDGTVRLGASSKADAQPDHTIRLVLIQTTPHVKRGKYRGGSAGPPSDGLLRIATDMLDVPAEIIGLIFRYRWTIEVYQPEYTSIAGLYQIAA